MLVGAAVIPVLVKVMKEGRAAPDVSDPVTVIAKL